MVHLSDLGVVLLRSQLRVFTLKFVIPVWAGVCPADRIISVFVRVAPVLSTLPSCDLSWGFTTLVPLLAGVYTANRMSVFFRLVLLL